MGQTEHLEHTPRGIFNAAVNGIFVGWGLSTPENPEERRAMTPIPQPGKRALGAGAVVAFYTAATGVLTSNPTAAVIAAAASVAFLNTLFALNGISANNNLSKREP